MGKLPTVWSYGPASLIVFAFVKRVLHDDVLLQDGTRPCGVDACGSIEVLSEGKTPFE